jgi:hypothetical protein
MSRAGRDRRRPICDGDATIRVGGPQSDDGPPDPLEGLERGAAMAGAVFGRAVTVLDRAVTDAAAYGSALVAGMERETEDAMEGATRLEGDVIARLGGVIGGARGAVAARC